MQAILKERVERLREVFGLGEGVELLDPGARPPELTAAMKEHLAHFNIEWHVIPSGGAVPFDAQYVERFYPMRSRDFGRPTTARRRSAEEALRAGHRRLQGRVVGVETTIKPRYLPGNRQYYGTPYGFDSTKDPFTPYLGRAGFLTGTRYSHDYVSLREFLNVVNRDWREQGMMPAGYRLTICPPVIFNLVGTVFYPQWSDSETLELGFYRDEHGNATCFAVGSNAPGDFSYVHEIETDADWTLLGFRTALVPE